MSKNLLPNCNIFCNKNGKITLKDRIGGRSTYIGINSNHFVIDCYQVDGCFNKNTKNCDYLLLNLDKKDAYFIELKGSDILEAIKQINSSLEQICSKIHEFSIHGRIVLTKVYAPSLLTSHYIKLKKRLNSHGGSLKQSSNNRFEEYI